MMRAQETIQLSRVEGWELVIYVSELARCGLPMGGALRAAVRDLPTGRVPQALLSLAEQLDRGVTWDAALGAAAIDMPPYLRTVIEQAVARGDLASAMDDTLAHQRLMDDLGSRFRQSYRYPLLLLAFLLGWILFSCLVVVPGMHLDSLWDMFGDADNADHLIEFARVMPRMLGLTAVVGIVALAAVRLCGGKALVSRLFCELPLLGKAWWYCALIDYCGLLAPLVEREVPLGEALSLVATASRDSAIRRGAQAAASDVDRGMSLAEAMARHSIFPATMLNMLRWGETNGALAESLEGTRQMFQERFELQLQAIRLIVPPVVFLLVAASGIFFVFGVFGPLVRLIRELA